MRIRIIGAREKSCFVVDLSARTSLFGIPILFDAVNDLCALTIREAD